MPSDKKQIKYVRELYKNYEREYVNNQIQVWTYNKEVENPTYISKEQAEENKAIYEKRNKGIKAILEAYKVYLWEKFRIKL